MKIFEVIAIIFFDLIDKLIHQKKILRYFKKNKINITSYFDVGSHKGSYFDLINYNFPINQAILIEPQKNIFKIIKKKYFKNKKIKIYNFAISDKNSTQILHVNKHDLTTSLTKINKKNKYLNLKAKLFGGSINEMILSKNKINTVKLEKLIKQNKIKKIDLLKIDTEGHELQVLRGAGSSLKNKVRFVLIEFHNSNIFLKYNAKKIHKHLTNNNFELKRTFSFPFTTWEDRIYQNKKFNL